MKRLILYAALAVIFAQAKVQCQEKPSDAEKARMAAAYEELSRPGPEHKQLEQLVGDWDAEVKFWMDPGKTPMVVKGVAKNRMILGGRFLLSESKASGPMSMENLIIMGFDRRNKKYTTVEMDTQGTYWVTAAGEFDDSKKAIRLYGEDFDPALKHTQKYYFITRVINPNQYVTEVIFVDPEHTGGKKEVKVAEISHTRK